MIKLKAMDTRRDKELHVSVDTFKRGLLNIVGFLGIDLINFLEEEGKLIITGFRDASFSISAMFADIKETSLLSSSSEHDIDRYERITYLLKPPILKEFARLQKRSLTRSEACAVIMRALMQCVGQDDENMVEVRRRLSWILGNIKSRARKDTLYDLKVEIKTWMSDGSVGKYRTTDLNLSAPSKPKERLLGPSVRIEGGDIKKVLEISWNDKQ